jgi:NADH-quinone oxidoreductase subunit N
MIFAMTSLHLETGLGVLALLLVLVESFGLMSRRAVGWTAMGGLLLALVLLPGTSAHAVAASLQPFYATDGLAVFYKGLALVSTFAVVAMSLEYAPVINNYISSKPQQTKEAGLGEFFSLPLVVCVGLMIMASARDLITIFVSLELTTVSFYVLVAFMRRSLTSLEAGVKYLILGALSTGLLVYGLAWVYGLTGQTTLTGIAEKIAVANWKGSSMPLLFGAALVLAGLGFKVAAVPFQIWVPDVYQGAPTPVTAFLSVGSKASGFIVLTRLVTVLAGENSVIRTPILQTLFILAGATILVGNLAAIGQTNFKRLLAYSSISHAGYLLLALACVHGHGLDFTPAQVVAFYLATYLPMTMICFLVLSTARAHGMGEDIASLRGFAKQHKLAGLALTLALASLAGLPLTAGFIGKFLVFFSVVLDGFNAYPYLAIAVIGAAAGFYYYFKVILALYSKAPESPITVPFSPLSRALLVLFTVAIIVAGVCPGVIRSWL